MSCNKPLIYIPGSIACSISVCSVATWWSISTAARIILEIDNGKKGKHYKNNDKLNDKVKVESKNYIQLKIQV